MKTNLESNLKEIPSGSIWEALEFLRKRMTELISVNTELMDRLDCVTISEITTATELDKVKEVPKKCKLAIHINDIESTLIEEISRIRSTINHLDI
jgi:hypothetical protein